MKQLDAINAQLMQVEQVVNDMREKLCEAIKKIEKPEVKQEEIKKPREFDVFLIGEAHSGRVVCDPVDNYRFEIGTEKIRVREVLPTETGGVYVTRDQVSFAVAAFMGRQFISSEMFVKFCEALGLPDPKASSD